MNCSLPGSSVHGILQARIQEWVAISFFNRWDAAKAVLRGKFIVIQSYLKKQEKHRIDSLSLNLKQLEKEKQKNPKISRRKEIIKIPTEINDKEMKETIVKINKTKS